MTDLPGVSARPRIVAVMGSTGCGKSAWLKRELDAANPKRLLIWDYSPVPEYDDRATYVALTDVIRASSGATFRVAYAAPIDAVRRRQAFDLFCRAALRAGRCTVVVEELRYVTTPSRSPDSWAALVMVGRKAGLQIYGTSQRPSHVDKDFLGNCTQLHCGQLGYDADVETMSREMRLTHEEREKLLHLPPLQWMHRDRESGQLLHGKIDFPKRNKVPAS